jgi:hypothetical protein
VFDAIASEAIAAYDKMIGLDLTEVALDGYSHKSPACRRRNGLLRA